MSLGFGILSWHGYDALLPSLSSYKAENLFSLFDENVIFLPEQRPQETELAQLYGLNICGSEKNLGILGGFKALAMSMTSDVVILVENDCPLIESFDVSARQIQHAYELLMTGKTDIVRLRSRAYPGQDWGVNRKYRHLYPDKNASFFKHFTAALIRLCRPEKTKRMRAWSLYESITEAEKFPDYVTYDLKNDCYHTLSEYMTWTNQSIMIKRDFFLQTIIAYAEIANTTRRINGFRNLEIEMNGEFWRKSGFKIAIPQGIFTHRRVGDRGYDISVQR